MSERVQKVIAQTGVGSRRAVEAWIQAGRVQVNGKLATLGCKVTPECEILLDKKPIAISHKQSAVLLYHKPVGEVCSHQPEPHQRSIYQSLPKPPSGKWLSVGRLDINTSGLIILTNDGETLQRLQHPKYNHVRQYRVRAYGKFDRELLKKLQGKVMLEDGPAKFLNLSHDQSSGSNHWFTVTLSEGRNRLVRRMFQAFDLEVNRLIRTKFGHTELPRRLKPGQYQLLNEAL